MTIVTHNCSIQAHKAVICSASPVIDRTLSGNFQEAQQDTYTIHTEKHKVVCRFIQYCYLSQYDIILPPDLSTPSFSEAQILQDKSGIIQFASQRLDTAGDLMQAHIMGMANKHNPQRLLLDIAIYRIGDIYDISALRVNASTCLKTWLDVLLREGDNRASNGAVPRDREAGV